VGDDLTAAKKIQEEALRIRKEIGEPGTAAESQLELASVALEDRRFEEAEKLAMSALDEFRAEKLSESEVLARIVLARIFLAQGKTRDGRREIEQANGLAVKSAFVGVRLSYAIVSARVKAASGMVAEGLRIAEGALAEAERLGNRAFVLEAGLAIGEMEIKLGRTEEGRKRVKAVEESGRETGFLGVARRAKDILK
jgi:ATP/maltotriose-dependent transcriptional regulator MalT